jgi:hypothetical protein
MILGRKVRECCTESPFPGTGCGILVTGGVSFCGEGGPEGVEDFRRSQNQTGFYLLTEFYPSELYARY